MNYLGLTKKRLMFAAIDLVLICVLAPQVVHAGRLVTG